MKVGYIQMKPAFGDIEANLTKAKQFIMEGKSADLLVLPELFNTGYLFENKSELREVAEKVPEGTTSQALIELARQTQTFIVAGLAEEAKDKFYYSAVVVGPGGFIDVYRKVHLFDKEKLWFDKGLGLPQLYPLVINKEKVTIGIIVCFDWIFPELTRILALQGMDILCHPANLVLPFAQKTMLARSIENRIYTITSNRIGREKRPSTSLEFTGMSQITSPKMELLAQSDKEVEEVKIVEISPSLAQDKNITFNNHIFQDRRVDLYDLKKIEKGKSS